MFWSYAVAGVSSAVIPTVTGVHDLALLFDGAGSHAVACVSSLIGPTVTGVHLSLSMLLLATMLLQVFLHLVALLLLASLHYDVAA
jgi:hypothetical protein